VTALLRPGRLLAIVAVLAFVALLTYGVVSKAGNDDVDGALRRGVPAPAPGFDLALLSAGRPGRLPPTAAADGRLSLDELRGRPVVLNVWASWCPPCRVEQPMLVAAAERTRGSDAPLFVGLNMQDLTGDARGYLAEFGVGYPTIRDPSDATSRRWGATGLPETFFVDARGRVVGHVIGAVSREQLAAGIEAARTGRVLGARAGGERREVQ
jgi:cytochrome c biogenesis protein CcmG/thiol:disulfide interchange protein DsbE